MIVLQAVHCAMYIYPHVQNIGRAKNLQLHTSQDKIWREMLDRLEFCLASARSKRFFLVSVITILPLSSPSTLPKIALF
jgi:hypothetical protein